MLFSVPARPTLPTTPHGWVKYPSPPRVLQADSQSRALYSLFVVTDQGSWYSYQLDPLRGGECTLRTLHALRALHAVHALQASANRMRYMRYTRCLRYIRYVRFVRYVHFRRVQVAR